jgi:hypothetical protein
MKSLLGGLLFAALVHVAHAERIDFSAMPTGAIPADWQCGVTGKGAPHWTIEPDTTAPSGKQVLKQTGVADFSWCVLKRASVVDGTVEVKFKPVSGKEDRAGGLVWRWKDGDNYYVARANALENNVSLYYTEKGRRITIKYVVAPVPANRWHTLRVEFSQNNIKVFLNGKKHIDIEDSHIAGPGALGVWTKADSVTSFDDFAFAGK